MSITTTINGKSVTLEAEPDTPLLWVLREDLKLTGTKFGCGVGVCGACSVHVEGQLTFACMVTVSDVANKQITTIEGIAPGASTLHALQEAWINLEVPQCGYCQSGQIMAALALLQATPRPTDAQIDSAMTNICRCGTYPRIREAIHAISAKA
jgi:isoquinoline 1-oxidoreductase subunit alpha